MAHRGRRHRALARCSRSSSAKPNPLELFQIWLNLPGADKLVEPHFTMLLGRDVPHRGHRGRGRYADRASPSIAGALASRRAPSPPPHSWAAPRRRTSRSGRLKLEPHAPCELAPALGPERCARCYFSEVAARSPSRSGSSSRARPCWSTPHADAQARERARGGRDLDAPGPPHRRAGGAARALRDEHARARSSCAMSDYRRTRFGGWPWPSDDPVHAREKGRFARHADGRVEELDR